MPDLSVFCIGFVSIVTVFLDFNSHYEDGFDVLTVWKKFC